MARGALLAMMVSHLRLQHRVSFPEFDVPQVDSDGSPEEAELAARECRAHWGLPFDKPIKTLGRVIESAGVVLMRLPAATEDVDAFARKGIIPMIVLNSERASASRARFNMGHELGHMCLHGERASHHDQVEKQAQQIQRCVFDARCGIRVQSSRHSRASSGTTCSS